MLLQNAFVQTQEGLKRYDMRIDNGKIDALEHHILPLENEQCIDVSGQIILPGLVDLNVRFSNSILNQSHIDKLATRCLRGGVTTAVVMADFTPLLESATLLELVKFKIDEAPIQMHMSAPLAHAKDDVLYDIATLLNNGACAILANSHRNANLLRRGMQYASMKHKPLFVQCYEPNLDDNGVMNEGVIASKLGLSGISKVSETTEVAKVSEMAGYYGATVVFKNVSTKRSVEIVFDYKKSNPSLFSEVSIHHLVKNETACDGFNTYAKLMPPLREESERLALLEVLRNGKVDCLTSAHAPKSILYKDVAFEDAAFGTGSVEEFLMLMYTYLVKPGIIDFTDLIRLCVVNPAKVLGQKRSMYFEKGQCADVIVFDPSKTYQVPDKHSLYYGDTLHGRVSHVFINGESVLS